MQILKDAASARQFVKAQKHVGKPIGLVPTMGALHQGPYEFDDAVRENDLTIASILWNPIQFNNPADLASIHARLSAMLNCWKSWCQAVFVPQPKKCTKCNFKLSWLWVTGQKRSKENFALRALQWSWINCGKTI